MQLPAHTQLWIARPARTVARPGAGLRLVDLVRRGIAALRPTPRLDNPRSHRRAD